MPDLRVRALAWLARREHSRAELGRKLAAYAESEDEVERLLDSLEAERLLSDGRYASERAAVRGLRYGNLRLKQELQAQGVDGETLAAALAGSGDERERCRAVWAKKFGVLPASAEERARQMRFLQYRGFSPESIRSVLRAERI